MLMSNGMTEGQAEELALNGHIHGLEGPVITVVTKHGIHQDLHNPELLEANIDSYPATVVWTLHCSSNFRRTEDSDAAFDEVKMRTGWGGRRRRRWFRRIWRAVRRVARRIGRVARRAWRTARRFVRRVVKSIKSFGKCALGGLGSSVVSGALTGGIGAAGGLAKVGACATKKAQQLKSEASNIINDAKSEAKVLTNDVKGVVKSSAASAGVTVAHIYKKGEDLKKQLKAGKVTATAAIQKMEDQAVMEIVNSTVAVNSQVSNVKNHIAKGSKIVSKQGLKVANTANDLVSKR